MAPLPGDLDAGGVASLPGPAVAWADMDMDEDDTTGESSPADEACRNDDGQPGEGDAETASGTRAGAAAEADTALVEAAPAATAPHSGGAGRKSPGCDPSLPSYGSRLHAVGRCKPCAFHHTEGCNTGAGCPFCHLCPPFEKQRRKKLKQHLSRSIMLRLEGSDGAPPRDNRSNSRSMDRPEGFRRAGHSRQSSTSSTWSWGSSPTGMSGHGSNASTLTPRSADCWECTSLGGSVSLIPGGGAIEPIFPTMQLGGMAPSAMVGAAPGAGMPSTGPGAGGSVRVPVPVPCAGANAASAAATVVTARALRASPALAPAAARAAGGAAGAAWAGGQTAKVRLAGRSQQQQQQPAGCPRAVLQRKSQQQRGGGQSGGVPRTQQQQHRQPQHGQLQRRANQAWGATGAAGSSNSSMTMQHMQQSMGYSPMMMMMPMQMVDWRGAPVGVVMMPAASGGCSGLVPSAWAEEDGSATEEHCPQVRPATPPVQPSSSSGSSASTFGSASSCGGFVADTTFRSALSSVAEGGAAKAAAGGVSSAAARPRDGRVISEETEDEDDDEAPIRPVAEESEDEDDVRRRHEDDRGCRRQEEDEEEDEESEDEEEDDDSDEEEDDEP